MKDNREKAELFSDAIGQLDENIVIEAEKVRYPKEAEEIYFSEKGKETMKENTDKKKKGNGKKIWIPLVSAAACGGIVLGTLFGGGGSSPFEHAVYANTVAEAKYPEMAPYPDETALYSGNEEADRLYEQWREQRNKRYEYGKALDIDSLQSFYKRTSKVFLNGSEGENENRIYSPVNIYMALAMLAEITEGNSRGQILELAGADTIEELRTQAAGLWNACYRNDNATTSILANSLWLDSSAEFNGDTIDTLVNDYFASVYRGSFASEETVKALKDWLNQQTEGLLEEAVDNLIIDPETIMALCSTICFHAKWDLEFNENNNDIKTFHGTGGDVQTEFMNVTGAYGSYYWGEDYGAACLRFEEGGAMWFILPDEDKTTADVLNSGEFLDMLRGDSQWENSKQVQINYSVPKFDVNSDMELSEGLKELGVSDVFDGGRADFSPLSKELGGMCVSKAKHAARVMIDEEGCTAVAFTAMLYAGASIPPADEVDFVVDRPFVFVIMSDTDQVLFMGTVENLG